MSQTPLQQLAGARPERLDRLPLAPVRQGRRARGPRAPGRDGRHVQPDDLPGRDRRGRRLRRPDPRGAERRDDDPKEIFLALAARRHPRRLRRPARRRGTRAAASDGWVSLEVDPTLAHDTEATTAEAARLHEMVDRPNLFIKIPATKEGLQAIEDTIARGHPGQRHADLLARAPPRGRPRPTSRGLRRAGRGRRRPVDASPRSPASSSRASTPRPTSASTRSAATTSSRASSRSPTPSSPTGPTRRSSPGPSGRRSRPRAPPRSAACGRRPSTKNPDYRDVIYVEELVGPTRSTRCRARPSRPSTTTARSAATRSTRTSTAPSACSTPSRRRASTTTTSSQTLEREGVEKFAKSLRGPDRGPREQARRSWRPGHGPRLRLPPRARPAAARRLGPRQRRRRLGPPDLLDVRRRPDGRAARRPPAAGLRRARRPGATTT